MAELWQDYIRKNIFNGNTFIYFIKALICRTVIKVLNPIAYSVVRPYKVLEKQSSTTMCPAYDSVVRHYTLYCYFTVLSA